MSRTGQFAFVLTTIITACCAGSASAQDCAFFDDFQRPDSNTVGFGWVEVETIDPEILLTSSTPFSFVDIVGTGVAPVSMTQFGIDTSTLAKPAVRFVWLARNDAAEVTDLLQVDWRLSGGTWEQLAEFDLATNTDERLDKLVLPPAALNTIIDIRFVVIVDEFPEGIFLDDVGVCEADCNTNGIEDMLEIAEGSAPDFNNNLIPDECDECVFDGDCTDADFCNGVETCDVDTCESSGAPCVAGQTCEEATDTCPPTGADCNTNGLGDTTDIAGGTSVDLNGNSIPDECDECVNNDADCDNGDFCDGVETCIVDTCVPGTSPCGAGQVCNEGTDACDPDGLDCNNNSVSDATDISGGTSADLNSNLIPDECDECVVDGDCTDTVFCNGVETCNVATCESSGDPCPGGQTCDIGSDACIADGPDCNTNGIGDATDITSGFSDDLNANTIPDECDECVFDADCTDTDFCNGVETCNVDTCQSSGDPCLAGQTCEEATDSCPPTGADCNNNGIGDLTDIAGGTSTDANANGIPDECDECVVDGDCDDTLFCNGAETCSTDTCIVGMNPCSGGEICDETGDACVINTDCNSNGVDDSIDIAGSTSDDANANSVPDECDECVNDDAACDNGLYCDGAETCDVDRCVAGALPCLVGQTCEEATDTCPPTGADCNTNGIGDAADIAGGGSFDVNTNGIPDECDECAVDGDCDDGEFCNGAEVCNGDTCESGTDPCLLGEVCEEIGDMCVQPDCNTNGIGDLNDITGGTSTDSDVNGIPDECEGCIDNADCDDGLFCNGAEVCNAGVCEAGAGPCQPGLSCNETNDACESNGGGGGGGGGAPADGDSDGVPDGTDDCPDTPIGESVDTDGCAESQLDADADGVTNDIDTCPDTPTDATVDANGCAASQVDTDNDGVTNDADTCPDTPAGETVDADGCSESQLDDDVVVDPDPDPQPGPGDGGDGGDGNDGGDGGDAGDGRDGGDGNDGGDTDPVDSDGDGVPDDIDECALTPAGFQVNAVGCALVSPDDDDDGEQAGCADGLCGAGGVATLTMVVLGFGGLKFDRRRIRRKN